MEQRRRLAAIVFADIAGYTSQSHEDEEGALASRRWITNLIRDRCIAGGGRVVKTLGDGALLEFSSAVEAVSCSVEIQEQVETDPRNAISRIRLRIGIHVGDVVDDGGDVLGNAVNVASRVQGVARPGGICITREVYTYIRPILRLRCRRVAFSDRSRLPNTIEVLEVGSPGRSPSLAPTSRGMSRLWPVLAAASLGTVAVLIVIALRGSASERDASRPPVSTATAAVRQPESPQAAASLSAKENDRSIVGHPEAVNTLQEERTQVSPPVPPPQTPPPPEMTQEKSATVTSEQAVMEPLPFQVQRRRSAEIAPGERRVIQEGRSGTREIVYRVTQVDGREVERVIARERILVPPVDRVVMIGAPPSVPRPPWICSACRQSWRPDIPACPNDGTLKPDR